MERQNPVFAVLIAYDHDGQMSHRRSSIGCAPINEDVCIEKWQELLPALERPQCTMNTQ